MARPLSRKQIIAILLKGKKPARSGMVMRRRPLIRERIKATTPKRKLEHPAAQMRRVNGIATGRGTVVGVTDRPVINVRQMIRAVQDATPRNVNKQPWAHDTFKDRVAVVFDPTTKRLAFTNGIHDDATQVLGIGNNNNVLRGEIRMPYEGAAHGDFRWLTEDITQLEGELEHALGFGSNLRNVVLELRGALVGKTHGLRVAKRVMRIERG